MVNPFEHKETISNELFNEHTSHLNIEENLSPKVLLLRGIVGSTKIKHVFTNTEFIQSVDYLDLENRNTEILPIDRLRNYVSPDIEIEEFCKFFKESKFLYQNNSFFERLNNEFANYYYHTSKGSHTTAFVYIYRILEIISYSFPLIYASKAEDFKGTYTYLKDCFAGNKDKGELGFFKSFIKIVFKNDPIYESSLRIDITADTSDIQTLIHKSFRKVCPPELFDDRDTNEPTRIAIKFTEYSSFIINLRNRFFHLSNSGQHNLESDDIYDADHFFSLCNKQSINWISIVLIEVLKFSIERAGIASTENPE